MGDNSVQLQIYPTSPATHFDKVDETYLSANDDTDYVFASTGSVPAILDMYNFTNHTSETGTINYIQVVTRARAHPCPQALAGEYRHKIICNSGTSLSSNFAPLPTPYQPYSSFWTVRPADGLAWTWADIDALVVGVQCQSPLVVYTIDTRFTPDAAGTANQNNHILNGVQNPGDATNYTFVDEEIADDLYTYIQNTNYSGWRDSYNIPAHDPLHTGTINNVRMQGVFSGGQGNGGRFWFSLRIGGVYYDSGYFDTSWGHWDLFEYQWLLNPATAAAWSWAVIDALEIGCKLGDVSTNWWLNCTQLYLVVNHTESVTPEIRTTQCYVKVNYIPDPISVTLLAPSEVKFSNTRRTERFIFPDGTYCIGDYGRAGKKMTMAGSETINAILKMRQCQAMLLNPSPVSISGLLDVNQDTQWRLSDFDFEYDISGDHYVWNAEFTAYNEVGA